MTAKRCALNQPTPDIETLNQLLVDEVTKGFNWPLTDWRRALVEKIVSPGTRRFAALGVEFDRVAAEAGFAAAARHVLPRFLKDYAAHGLENIPRSGPLIVASNHPGTCDSLVLAACIDRPDFRIVAGGIPFLQLLPNVSQSMIYTPYNRNDAAGRMRTMRASLRHVERGGCILLYPTTFMDPDPDCMPNAGDLFPNWSRSLEIFLRQVPEARVQTAMISGVLDKGCQRHPITFMRRPRLNRQRLGETLQVITQMLAGKQKYNLRARVSFGEAVAYAGEYGVENSRGMIIRDAQELLKQHMEMEEAPRTF